MPRRRKFFLISIGFFLGVSFAFLGGKCREESFLNAQEENPLRKDPHIREAIAFQQVLRKIYQEVSPSVVLIETEQIIEVPWHPFFNDPFFRFFFGIPKRESPKQKRQGLGSGFIISKEGYIVTNHHVIAKVDKITVKLHDGRSFEAEVIGSDKTSDIALLKIKGNPKNLKPVYIGDSDKVEVGDIVMAIGNPFGLASTFTFGVISSKGRENISPDGIPRIQTDAAINPGNSGGPLINLYGEVIGINQMIYTRSGGYMGIGFAIPINYAITVIEKLRKGEEITPGYIGVEIIPNPSGEDLEALGLKGKKGLLIGRVVLRSPAWKAGLRSYDFITHVDGKPATSFSVLKGAVIRKGPGKKIRLKVLRNGKPMEFVVTIGKMPKELSG